MAPEVIEYGEVTPFSDVWAVGCIAYELCTGLQLPHTRGLRVIDGQNVKDYAYNIDISEISSKFSIVMPYVIINCLMWDPSARPTARRVLDNILQRSHSLNFEAWETCRILPRTECEQLDDKRAGSDDDWVSLSSYDDCNRDIVGPSIEVEPTGTLGSAPSAGQSSLLRSLGLPFDVNDMPMDQYSWTTGEEATLTHRQIIDGGASGEVHEVQSLQNSPENCLSD
jgi:serine/threonine protein kinase